MNWDRTFYKVEEALGFKLYDWQKDYISMNIDFIPVEGRRNGKTLAFILRYLLNYETKLRNHFKLWRGPYYENLFPIDNGPDTCEYIHGWYPQYVIEVNNKLRSVGLETYLV